MAGPLERGIIRYLINIIGWPHSVIVYRRSLGRQSRKYLSIKSINYECCPVSACNDIDFSTMRDTLRLRVCSNGIAIPQLF